MNKDASIFVAGHRGLVGAAILRRLEKESFERLIVRTHAELDLTNQAAVDAFFVAEKPQFVFLAAGKVGGIYANSRYPAEFLRDNLLIQANVIDAAYRNGVSKLLFLGSSCIYPKYAAQPISEDALLTGSLEPTNEWYAIAKIAGLKMSQAYRRQYRFNVICAMPTNLYGPGDNFDLENAHVLPALIRKVDTAKRERASAAVVWGSGAPRREFLHVDDLADACLYLMQNYDDEQLLNIGWGKDVSIRELAQMIRDVVGFPGELAWDTTKPDGTPRKLLDVARLDALGWRPQIGLKEGIESTYRWFLDNPQAVRGRDGQSHQA